MYKRQEVGRVYVNPASHGEGRFVAPKEWIDRLFENGQVATQYSDPDGSVSMDEEWNVNGSYAAIEGITSPDGRILGKMCIRDRSYDRYTLLENERLFAVKPTVIERWIYVEGIPYMEIFDILNEKYALERYEGDGSV